MRSALLQLLLALAAGGPVLAADPSLFAYDPAAPLDVRETGVTLRGDVTVRDLTFVGVKDPVQASLVGPAGAGPRAAVLYVHWFGDPRTTNRTQFLDEAVALARRGVVSLLVDAMWARPGWWQGRTPETDRLAGVQQVVELRRALDLLLAQPGVDPARLAVVGHDFGAMFGSVMGAADRRPRTYVLMAPTPRLADWYLFNVKPASIEAYKEQLAPLDPVNAVPHLAPAAVFYQFAAKDKYVPRPRPAEFYDATAPRKFMATYDCEHEMLLPAIAADRVAWLERELGLR